MQLIASELIRLDFDEDSKCYCKLNVTQLIPAYLDDNIWDVISIVDETK